MNNKPFDPMIPNETRLRLLRLVTERRQIQSSNPLRHILDEEPNLARRQTTVTRGAVIFGKNHIQRIADFKQKGMQYGPSKA